MSKYEKKHVITKLVAKLFVVFISNFIPYKNSERSKAGFWNRPGKKLTAQDWFKLISFI